METFVKVKKVLKDREVAILSMEKKLNRSNSLSRTLLDALVRSIGSSDLLSYDERQAIKKETDDLCKGIDFEVLAHDDAQEQLQEREKEIQKVVGKIDIDY
tara:strand:- start:17 stop:319 length:303 start_codon:yes stop_codon:yes gene_type:complete